MEARQLVLGTAPAGQVLATFCTGNSLVEEGEGSGRAGPPGSWQSWVSASQSISPGAQKGRAASSAMSVPVQGSGEVGPGEEEPLGGVSSLRSSPGPTSSALMISQVPGLLSGGLDWEVL